MNSQWFKLNRIGSIIGDALQVWGIFTVISAVADFFPALAKLSAFLKHPYILWVTFFISIIYALVKNKPPTSFIFKIKNRDTEIELRVDDLFKIKDPLVIPINSEFDVYLNGSVQGSKSLQSKMTSEYFEGDKNKLRKKIKNELRKSIYTSQKDGNRYKLGTTVYLSSLNEERKIYLLANSHKINAGRVEVTPTDFYATLPEFWSFVGAHCPKENIAMPLIGTGNGRLTIPREDVYKEIVRSFISSCAGKNCCSKLIVVIHESDIDKFNIDIEDLVDFTRLQASHADFTTGPDTPNGQPSE